MNNNTDTGNAGPRRALLGYLIATALISGALVMVVEVLGSRVIGPFFGVSLFVWTSLITVTMIALAAGYAVGGFVADRRGTPDYLYGILLVAGLAVLLVPVLKGAVLKLCFPLGLRLGTFVSALLLFAPSLFLLGCVSPYLVKIATRQLKRVGRTVGGFYALSTFGSVLGTVLTGFVLIAYLGVDQIFGVVGALLIFLAVVYFLFFRRKWLALVAIVLPGVLFPRADVPGTSRLMANGTRVTLVAARDSFYGNIKVVDYTFGAIHTREMIIDGLIQGGVDMYTGLSIYPAPYFLEFIPYGIYPRGKKCLVIGLGAGIIPRWYEQRGITTDVVDIDPQVVDFAQKYFGFSISGEITIADARYFLARSEKKYDFVILDVFNGDITPGYLVSREAVTLLKRRLTSDGVLGVNLIGSIKRENLMTASIIKTLKEIFDQVDVFPNFGPENKDGMGNLTVIAYTGPSRTMDPAELMEFPVHPMARKALYKGLGQRFEFPKQNPAFILTDDYNPIDFYDAWVRESVRKDILRGTHWDILIQSR